MGRKLAKIGPFLAAVRSLKDDPLIPDGFSAIAGESWRANGQSDAAQVGPLSRPWARPAIPYFWGHFAAAIGEDKNAPK